MPNSVRIALLHLVLESRPFLCTRPRPAYGETSDLVAHRKTQRPAERWNVSLEWSRNVEPLAFIEALVGRRLSRLTSLKGWQRTAYE
jgi:hypothetical protein